MNMMPKKMKHIAVFLAVVCTLMVQAQPSADFSLPRPIVEGLKDGPFAAANGAEQQEDYEGNLSEQIKDSIFNSPDVLNEFILESALVSSFLENSPLTLEFKMIDREDEDSVLGLEFSYAKSFSKKYLKSSDKTRNYYEFDFSANGTLTGDAEENPRNFIETKIGIVGGKHTAIPQQSLATIKKANKLRGEADIDNEESYNELTKLMDSILEPLRGFTFINYGADIGYETDQEFDAQNQKISGFLFAQYESWDDSSFLGSLRLVPAVRLSIDTIEPNSDTPRAKAGDDSSYQRASAEISLWMPVTRIANQPLALTYNYRYFEELGASDAIKSADLSRYSLRTFTLSGPNGVFASYSSGRLPFSEKSEQTVELGWKTYF